MVTEGTIEDVQSLIGAVTTANDRFGSQVWWRGQRNSSWHLDPSISRQPHNARSEQSLVARFRHKAPSRHPKVPPSNDRAGWLFLMQHFRLPTRLLDWTESPLVACFFAAQADPAMEEHRSVVRETDGALFALSPYRLNDSQINRPVLLLPDDPEPIASINRAFDRDLPESTKVLAVRPSEVDVRLMVQLSVFTLHGGAIAMEDVQRHESFIIKWQIPAASKKMLRKELKALGVRASSIFPDLEHLATDVASTRFKEPGKGHGDAGHDVPDDDWHGGEDSS